MKVFLFDRDDTLINGSSRLELANQALNPNEHRFLFKALELKGCSARYGIISTGGENNTTLVLKTRDMNLFKKAVFGSTDLADAGHYLSRNRPDSENRVEHRNNALRGINSLFPPEYSEKLSTLPDLEKSGNKTFPFFPTFMFVDIVVKYDSEQVTLFYPDCLNPTNGKTRSLILDRSDLRFNTTMINGVTYTIDLALYLENKIFYDEGDAKLIQSLITLAKDGIAVEPSEGMKALGITAVSVSDDSDVTTINPEDISFVDDKIGCVALMRFAGMNAHLAGNHRAVEKENSEDTRHASRNVVGKLENQSFYQKVRDAAENSEKENSKAAEAAINRFVNEVGQAKQPILDENGTVDLEKARTAHLDSFAQELGYDDFNDLENKVLEQLIMDNDIIEDSILEAARVCNNNEKLLSTLSNLHENEKITSSAFLEAAETLYKDGQIAAEKFIKIVNGLYKNEEVAPSALLEAVQLLHKNKNIESSEFLETVQTLHNDGKIDSLTAAKILHKNGETLEAVKLLASQITKTQVGLALLATGVITFGLLCVFCPPVTGAMVVAATAIAAGAKAAGLATVVVAKFAAPAIAAAAKTAGAAGNSIFRASSNICGDP